MVKYKFPTYVAHVKRIMDESKERAASSIKPLRLRGSKVVRRQDGPPPPPPPPGEGPSATLVGEPSQPSAAPEETTDEEDDSESEEGEDDSSDEGEAVENPFAAGTNVTESTTTTLSESNPFVFQTTLSTSTTSSISTQVPPLTTGTATGTGTDGLQPTSPSSALADKESPRSDGGGLSPNTLTAVVIGSILGVVSICTLAYFLFRYCGPVKTWAGARRGKRRSRAVDSESNSGSSNSDPGPMVQRSFTHIRGLVRFSTSTTATSRGPVPPYAPPGITPFVATQDGKLENPFLDQVPPPSRTPSNRSLRSIGTSSSGYSGASPMTSSSALGGAYESDFRMVSHGHSRSVSNNHPTGLMQNPPSVVSNKRSNGRSSRRSDSDVSDSDLGKGVDLGVDLPMSPRSQFSYGLRKSITPSESASNGPFSPLPFPVGLMPPKPVVSRWSRNSSSNPSEWTQRPDNKPKERASRKLMAPLPVRVDIAPKATRTASAGELGFSKRSSKTTRSEEIFGTGAKKVSARGQFSPGKVDASKRSSKTVQSDEILGHGTKRVSGANSLPTIAKGRAGSESEATFRAPAYYGSRREV